MNLASITPKDVLPATAVIWGAPSQAAPSPDTYTPKAFVDYVVASLTALAITGGAVTASTPLFAATQTWNNAGITFKAIDINITDTASNAASLLMDLRRNATSVYNVDKFGNSVQSGSATLGSIVLSGNVSAAAWTTNGLKIRNVPATLTDTTSSGTVVNAYTHAIGGNTIAASSAVTFTNYFTAFIGVPVAGANVTLTNSWALGLGGNLQVNGSIVIPGSTSGSSTIRVAAVAGAATVFQLPANNGTADQVLRTDGNGVTSWVTPSAVGGSANQIQFNNGGALDGMAGTSWNNTARALTITGATVTTSNPILDLSQTWNAGGVTFTGWRLNVTDTASAAASLLADLRVGGVSQFNVSKAGMITVPNNGGITAPSNLALRTSSGSSILFFGADLANDFVALGTTGNGSLNMRSGGIFGWTAASFANTTQDLILGRRGPANLRLGQTDAAAPVAQTLSVQSVVAGTSNTAGQEFRIDGSQGTGTGAGGSIVFRVAPAGSSGSAVNALAAALTIATTAITAQNHLLFSADNTYDIGASGATRPRDLFLGRNLVQVGAYHEMAEMTAPAAPAANGVRIYAVDNGSGKTQLMALFATGAAQQIAIEP